MKLLTKTSLIYLLTTLLVFSGGGLVFYYNLQAIFDEEVSEKLFVQKQRIDKYVQEHDTVPPLSYESNASDYIRISSSEVAQRITDTTFFSREEEEELPYRLLTFSVKTKQGNYEVRISRPLFESDDLLEAILLSFVIIIGALLIVTLVVNRIVAARLWKPFFKTIDQLNSFRLDVDKEFSFQTTNTNEFVKLNAAIDEMTTKVRSDYRNLKAFSENASHELQTPLTIILSSTEQLLQSDKLTEEEVRALQTIGQTARRLSKLNQSLLLLSKIGNKQFVNQEDVDLTELMERKIEQFSELIQFKEIALETNIDKDMTIRVHPVLADVLVNNLLSNAVRHTEKNGKIAILLEARALFVSNSGQPLHNANQIFERFYKESTSSDSTGLGLALVKQICETCELSLKYTYVDGMHEFEIRF